MQIVVDTAERSVEVPEDLSDALDAAGLVDAFASLAPSHRKEYVRWITEAKKAETRQRRIEQAVVRIRDGRARR